MSDHTAIPPTDICGQLIDGLRSRPDLKVDIFEIVHALSDRAYALIIMLLALPNAVPGPYIPGLSIVTGLPALIYACEAALGRPRPRLPGFVGHLKLDRGKVIRHLERVRPYTLNLETLMRPRLSWIAHRHRLAFAYCAVLVLILTLPIPFGNVVTAWAIVLLAFALVRRDGLYIVLGALVGIVASAWNLVLVILGVEAVLYLMRD